MDNKIIEGEFRRVGEYKWAPFQRWLAPKLIKVAGYLIVFVVMTGTVLAMRAIQGAL